jgi:hypothetical protein
MSWPFFVSVEEPEQESDLQPQICLTYGCTALTDMYAVLCQDHLDELENLGLATDWISEPALEAVDWENRS